MKEFECLMAEGPAGLLTTLVELHEKTLENQSAAESEHYILYCFGDQKSLIKADFGAHPLLLWHFDLSKRSATIPLKNTIMQFLLEQGNGAEPTDCFLDVSRKKLFEEQKDFLDGGEMIPFNDMDPTLYNAFLALRDQHRNNFKPDKIKSDFASSNFFQPHFEEASDSKSFFGKVVKKL